VLSGHRGLPSARLFTDLDKLNVGDTFILHILDEVLTYEVDQILIVDPEEMDALEIDPEQDLCTLVTCTPYSINTHRLLVRGHRVENASSSNVRVTADAIQIEPVIVAPALAVPILLLLLILLLVTTRKKKQKRER
jgi:sortase A